MKLPGKIFIVSHEATYTGAPILLLNLLQILKENLNIKFTILLLRDGNLRSEFSKIGKVIVFKKADYAKSQNVIFRVYELILSRFILIISVIKSISYPLIFSNTLINGQVYRYFKFLKKPTLVYVHELTNITQFYPYDIYISPFISGNIFFFYPSGAVKNYLINHLNIDQRSLYKLNYFIPDLNKVSDNDRGFNTEIFQNDNSFLICGMGVASPRKGTDIFLEVASIVSAIRKDIRFIWIGGFASSELEKEYRELIQKYDLDEIFHFTGMLSPIDAKQLLSKSDILFLSSREDPYPLVVLEAAMFTVPSIVFRDGGGITDFVNFQSGWVVDDFDVKLVSEIILRVNSDEIKSKGLKAREFYKVKHSSNKMVISQFLDCIYKI